MTTGQLSIDVHPVGQEEIVIEESPAGSTDKQLRVFSKTPNDFLNHKDYTAPKYAICTSGTMSCKAKKTLAGSEEPLYLKINGEKIGQANIGKAYKDVSGNFPSETLTNIQTVITNLEQGDKKGYMTLAGPATWSCNVNAAIHHLYLQHPKIVLNYTCPKFTINLETNDSAMGTVTFADGFSSKEFDVTEKKWTKTTTITATPNDGYFFIKWDDDDKGKEGPSRKIALAEESLTENNTQLTYKAIFGKKELYVGSKRLDAIYVGTKKAKVYRGSTRIL